MGVVQLGCSAASSMAAGAAQVQHGLAVGTVGGFHTTPRQEVSQAAVSFGRREGEKAQCQPPPIRLRESVWMNQ